jgi:hypothetical protein
VEAEPVSPRPFPRQSGTVKASTRSLQEIRRRVVQLDVDRFVSSELLQDRTEPPMLLRERVPSDWLIQFTAPATHRMTSTESRRLPP